MKLNVSRKLVGTNVLTVVFICTVISIFLSKMMKENQIDSVEERLAVSAYNFMIDYEQVTDREITDFKKVNDIDVTIFTDDVRTQSTIDGAVGSHMDSGIWNSIQTGNNYFATDANVNGHAYYGYYIPIMENGECVGASFTGIPQEDAKNTIIASVAKIIAWVVGCGLVASGFAWILVRRMVKSIKNMENTVNSLIENDLTAEHEKYKNPSDEIESICNKVAEHSFTLLINRKENK